MAHQDTHTHRTVIEDRTGYGAGMLVAVAAIILLALVAFAVLWTQPWDDNSSNTNPNVPGITDDSGGGGTGGGDSQDNSGGSGGGTNDGGTGGGDVQPPQ